MGGLSLILADASPDAFIESYRSLTGFQTKPIYVGLRAVQRARRSWKTLRGSQLMTKTFLRWQIVASMNRISSYRSRKSSDSNQPPVRSRHSHRSSKCGSPLNTRSCYWTG